MFFLDLYRTSQDASDEWFSVLEYLKSFHQLYVTRQVNDEFYRRRIDLIEERNRKAKESSKKSFFFDDIKNFYKNERVLSISTKKKINKELINCQSIIDKDVVSDLKKLKLIIFANDSILKRYEKKFTLCFMTDFPRSWARESSY